MKLNFLALAMLFLFLSDPFQAFGQGLLPRRNAEPVILEGAQVRSLIKTPVNLIVGFRYSENGKWTSVPVQIDERDSVTAGKIYGKVDPSSCVNDNWCIGLENLKLLVYTDPNTFTGSDTDPLFDANDELVFMVKDGGYAAPEGELPSGVVETSGIRVKLTDPVDKAESFLYLFKTDPSTRASSRSSSDNAYINYEFKLIEGPYIGHYNQELGPNPEHSFIATPYYQMGFSERWIKSEMKIVAGSSTGVDILDRHKALFAPDNCGRHEETFSYAEGAFITNKTGPVRAIRAYMGANSGPLTEREHIFYEEKEVIHTWLRVHSIPGIMDFYDYSPEAEGMVYKNNNNPGGVVIDGNPDQLTSGRLEWEMVSGEQGIMYMEHDIDTDIAPKGITSYYLDDKTPPVEQCTGDSYALGSSGIWVNEAIPATDLRVVEEPAHLKLTRTSYFFSPEMEKDVVAIQSKNRQNPIAVEVKKLQEETQGSIDVYPVPFDQNLTVESNDGIEKIKAVQLFNILGKIDFDGVYNASPQVIINTTAPPLRGFIS